MSRRAESPANFPGSRRPRGHAEVAVAVGTRRRHGSSEALDQPPGSAGQRVGSNRTVLGAVVDRVLPVEFARPF